MLLTITKYKKKQDNKFWYKKFLTDRNSRLYEMYIDTLEKKYKDIYTNVYKNYSSSLMLFKAKVQDDINECILIYYIWKDKKTKDFFRKELKRLHLFDKIKKDFIVEENTEEISIKKSKILIEKINNKTKTLIIRCSDIFELSNIKIYDSIRYNTTLDNKKTHLIK